MPGMIRGAESFGTLLRQYRASAALTQEQLAERAGLSRRGIADLERGARMTPYANTVERLSDALELSAQERTWLAQARGRRKANAGVQAAQLCAACGRAMAAADVA